MVGERRWGLKAALPLVAVMVAVGGWQGYKGVLKVLGEAHARAQIDGRFFQVPHFKCYVITPGTALNEQVTLGDQFHPLGMDATGPVPSNQGGESVTVRAPSLVCTPVTAKCRTIDDVQKCEFFEEPLVDFDGGGGDHLKCYDITPSGPPVNQAVTVFDQFHDVTGPPPVGSTIPQGGESVTVRTARFLCTPARKCIAGRPCGTPDGGGDD